MESANIQRKAWSEKDNELLQEAIQKYGQKWQLVANHIKTRTPSQCAQRWKRIKQKMMQKRNSGVWTKDEITKLKVYVKEYGQSWHLLSEMLPNKTSKQIRDKYINHLDPKIKKQPWTQEEDDILYENFLLYGSKWTLIKGKLPERSERMVKNRFYNYVRYTHLKLQNPYKLINNQVKPHEEIKLYRQKLIESQNITSQEPFEQSEDSQNEEYSKYFNLYDNFSQNYMQDI